MISLDQILLLQEKVENAVAKIAQLNAENAALRRKCAELTNALAAETEQFSSFQNSQNKIEEGILSALKKLDAVENKVLESEFVLNENQKKAVSSVSGGAENQKTENIISENSESVEKESFEFSASSDASANLENRENQNSLDAETVSSNETSNSALDFEKNPENKNNLVSGSIAENGEVSQNHEDFAEAGKSLNSEAAVNQNSLNLENFEKSSQGAENSQKAQEDSSSQPLFDIF